MQNWADPGQTQGILGSWTGLTFMINEKLLRKHDLVMKTQVLIPGIAGKGQTLGRPRADPVFDRGRLGQTLGRPRADRVDPGQIGQLDWSHFYNQ